jgi:jouberin
VFDQSKEAKILPHPTFVYAAKFHPCSDKIVCTGAYDKVIRVWSILKQQSQYGVLMQELYGHIGYINSICFSKDGFSLYSADSFGKIYCWNSYVKTEEVERGMYF